MSKVEDVKQDLESEVSSGNCAWKSERYVLFEKLPLAVRALSCHHGGCTAIREVCWMGEGRAGRGDDTAF